MKKILLLLVVVVASAYGYRSWIGSRAYAAYEGFAEAWAKEDRVAAEKFAAGKDVVTHAFDDRALRGNLGGASMEAFRGTSYAVESRTNGAGGAVKLVVLQTIRFDPPGRTTGVGGAMWARYRDEATIEKTANGWHVTAFEPTYVEMGEAKRR
ncbi:MAG TPA: hypothetical protein VH854_16030 [Thermoanaerobaculia bacterium]|jgi:hypothetical protein|nr:hypothetical protein [Thermoanaerobaculia bacterium]